MRTRLARPRPLQLVVAGSVLVLGLAGACSAGAPDAPSRQGTSSARRQAVAPTASTSPLTSEGDAGAKQIPGTGSLRYPDAMRKANREGEVHVMFVVDERGLVDTSSFKVRESTDPAFTAAVRAALPTMRFTPARKSGRAVRQVVELPFTFALQRN